MQLQVQLLKIYYGRLGESYCDRSAQQFARGGDFRGNGFDLFFKVILKVNSCNRNIKVSPFRNGKTLDVKSNKFNKFLLYMGKENSVFRLNNFYTRMKN